MAIDHTTQLIGLGSAAEAEAVSKPAPPDSPGGAVSARIMCQLGWALPIINVVTATTTYIFVTFIVPLPGGAPPAASSAGALLATVALVGVCWIVCELLGRRALAPVRRWLEADRQPNAAERARTLRIPLCEARHALIVWAAAGVACGVFDISLGGSVVCGLLVVVLVGLGGLVASGLTYLTSERIMRPATAMALASDPPTRPLLPGIATRIYLAWEFGTAVAVAGIVVLAVAYLAGAQMSQKRMAATVIFLGTIALLVGAGTLLVAIRSVADPVRAMRSAMRRVEAGDTEVTVAVDDGSEVGLLQAGFNRMVSGLRERDRVRELFGRHVGEEVARSALGRGLDLEGELREAAVLFVDVVGSTAYASAHDPREVVASLNRFFEVVVAAVTRHGGWVNKFEGDAALCVFGAPAEHPDPAGAALAAARELRHRLSTDLDGIDAAIGVSAGVVVAGNVGTAQRCEYTVIGDPANEAARLSELAKNVPGRLLASEAAVGRAGEPEAQRWQLGEPVVLRGRSAPTRVAAPSAEMSATTGSAAGVL